MIVAGRTPFIPLALFLLSWQPAQAVAAELRKINLSYSAVSMTWFPVKVAVEKGFFRNEGLEPQLIQMNGNVATVALAFQMSYAIFHDPSACFLRTSRYFPSSVG